jgi:hypothetical protein
MAKKTSSGQRPDIIQLLESTPNYHARNSIDRWQSAIRSFDSPQNPSRVMLYDMYEDLLMDGHLAAVCGKRQDSILNKRLLFTRDGVPDDDITAMLNSPDMRAIILHLHESVLYGYTLIQINDIRFDDEQEYYHIDFDLIPRKHVHPEPGFECISIQQASAERDFLYTQPPLANYMIAAGNPTDKGLLAAAAPYVIYKRDALGDWSEFSEMFGHPFREAIYEGTDDASRRRMEEFLERWGSKTYLVHPKNIQIIMHESGKNAASADIYDRLIATCDAGISKVILGNTLTTEQGENGARSLGEVHQDEEDQKKQSDENLILGILNTQFRSILKRFGINAANGQISFENPDADWQTMQTKWNIISAIANFVPVDDEFIYEEFNIPKPDDYDKRRGDVRSPSLDVRSPSLSAFDSDPDIDTTPPPGQKQSILQRLSGFFG